MERHCGGEGGRTGSNPSREGVEAACSIAHPMPQSRKGGMRVSPPRHPLHVHARAIWLDTPLQHTLANAKPSGRRAQSRRKIEREVLPWHEEKEETGGSTVRDRVVGPEKGTLPR